MSLKQRILDEVKIAMKAQQPQRVGVLRMLKAKILEAEVAQREAKGLDYQLEDTETLRVIGQYAKQRRESIESYRKGGRTELAAQEEAELKIVEEFLPQAASDDQVRAAVQAAIAELGATSKKEMGAVMKAALAKLQGSADGKLVNRHVMELLP
ncbi:MAG: GatB/YqeY domain-containing protein [Acidobacteriota bacterium]